MRESTCVLLLGLDEWSNAARKVLPPRKKDSFWAVSNVWDLCALPQDVSVDVAVFHHSFAADDLRYAAEYVRRRWLGAVILVIGEQAEQLDDPLYDDKASREISVEDLVRMIETSAAARRKMRRNARFGRSSARQ